LKDSSNIKKSEINLPVIRKDIYCTFCETNPIHGSLYMMLENFYQSNIYDGICCAKCYETADNVEY